MKTKVCLLFLFLLCIVQSDAQSSDRFIRIVGNASRTFTAHLWKAEVVIGEIKGSEIRKTVAVPIEEVQAQFFNHLHAMDIPTSALQPQEGKTSSGNQQMYQLTLSDPTKIQAFTRFSMDGVRIQSGKYSFAPVSEEEEKQMVLEAVADARQKAESLAHQIGMKVGKLLNIEDTSTGCCGEIRDAKESTSTQTYHVNVTFQLKG